MSTKRDREPERSSDEILQSESPERVKSASPPARTIPDDQEAASETETPVEPTIPGRKCSPSSNRPPGKVSVQVNI
ncbi:hypothetical protein BJY00DRAFT_313264 [Aspergillus carlsbadensis]|nr:hypothetical protein BJY00DRAFT_313264 [Aspergillus carlsbadensis]